MEARVEDGTVVARRSGHRAVASERGALCPPYRLARASTGPGRTYELIVYVTDAEQVEVV